MKWSWKEWKWTFLAITFEPLGVGGWNFAGWCPPVVSNFWLSFRLLLPIALKLWLFLCIEKFWFCFAHAHYQWSLGVPWVDFGAKVWILMVDANFGRKQANGIQNLKFVQKFIVVAFEMNLFWGGWDKLSLTSIDLITKSWVVKQWTWMSSISSTTLPRMTFVYKNLGFYL